MKNMIKTRNDVIFKWSAIPLCIVVVLAAGASYNLFAYFQQIGAAQGYGKQTMSIIKYTVLFGYYLGLIPGYIVRFFSPMGSYIFASLMALISFCTLGWIAENGDGSTFYWIIMMLSLFFGAMSGGIATIASIVTTVKSFPRLAGILLIVIFLSYYKVAPYLEYSIRSAFFEEPSLMLYFIGLGCVLAAIYGISAFVVREIDLGGSIENLIKDADRMGLLVYVLVEALLLASFYVVALIYEEWFIGAIILLSFMVLNFFVVGVAAKTVYDKLRSGNFSISSLKRDTRDEKLFEEMMKEPKYLSLVFASFLVIGVTSTFNFNIFQIAFSYGAIDQADHLLDSYWAADMFGRFALGLLAYFMIDRINGYKWAVGASVSVATGFGLILLTEAIGTSFLYIGTVFIGIGAGLFWVIVPSIVMEDAGENNFGLNWGLTLFVNALGMLLFGEFFDWIYEWQGEGSDKCTGGSCVLLQFIFFGSLALMGAGLTYYALGKDEEGSKNKKKTSSSDKDKKSRKSGTKDKKERNKSKDKKERGRSKGKGDKSSKTDKSGKKEKSAKKSTSKSRSKPKNR